MGWWLKRCEQGCAFWGFVDIAAHLGGQIPPNPNELNVHNIESFILSKLLYWFQPNFAQRQKAPSTIRVWSNFAPNKSKMADGHHFEKPLNCYIFPQPFNQLWWNLEQWRILAPYSGSTIKISNFWKSKMAAAAILKITKIAISAQRFDWSLRNLVCWCKMDLLTAPIVKKNRISQIQDGGRPPF